jgi:hypothetical protein
MKRGIALVFMAGKGINPGKTVKKYGVLGWKTYEE